MPSQALNVQNDWDVTHALLEFTVFWKILQLFVVTQERVCLGKGKSFDMVGVDTKHEGNVGDWARKVTRHFPINGGSVLRIIWVLNQNTQNKKEMIRLYFKVMTLKATERMDYRRERLKTDNWGKLRSLPRILRVLN